MIFLRDSRGKHSLPHTSIDMRSLLTQLQLASLLHRRKGPHAHHERRRFSSFVVEEDAVRVDALKASFPFVWLRDSCQCPLCIHPSTRQKLHRSSDFKAGLKPESVEAVDGELWVRWPGDGVKEAGHTSSFTSDFLQRYSSPSTLASFHHDVKPSPWTASHFTKREPFPYAELNDPRTLLEVYRQLLREGLVFFSGIPTIRTSNEECELRALAEKLSEIRKTFYGEIWDVRNVQSSAKNIAYTNLDLGYHMDLLYFKEPPRYQILHALCNRVVGGFSIFVDAFHAAQRLKQSSEKAYDILTSTLVPFHYINDGHHLHCSHPTLELTQRREGDGSELIAVNYSPPFQAPLPSSTPPSFYDALAEYVELMNDSESCVTRLLEEGDAVIFDNRRILHGRTAFHEHGDATNSGVNGKINRWLKGCYLEEDPVLDRYRVLSSKVDLQGSE